MFVPVLGNPTPGSTNGSALRRLRKRPLRRQHDQPRSQADTAAVASESGLDARHDGREASARARLHPLPQGREGHEGHLSTHGRGLTPPPEWSTVGGRHPPPAEPRPYFFFFLAFFFIERLTSFRREVRAAAVGSTCPSSSSSPSSSPNHLLPRLFSSPSPRAAHAPLARVRGARSSRDRRRVAADTRL